MILFKELLFFVISIIFNMILVSLFFSSFYILYFLFLFISSYIFQKYYIYFSHKIFFTLLIIVFIIIDSNIYDKIIFEVSLTLNQFEQNVYMNGEVLYILVAVHLLLLLNLKKFDKFWVIIDEKLFKPEL